MCFGHCPVYQVGFHADGRAEWNGEFFVERTGLFSGTIDAQAFSRLTSHVLRAGFFSWDPEYVQMVTDLPAYRIRVIRDAVPKEVLQYATEEPPGFGPLAAQIDSLAEAITWRKVDDGAKENKERGP